MVLCFHVFREVPDVGSRNVPPQPVLPSQPLLRCLAPALPAAVPLPHWGRRVRKSWGKVHLQKLLPLPSLHLCSHRSQVCDLQ